MSLEKIFERKDTSDDLLDEARKSISERNQAERTSLDSENKFIKIFHSIPVAMALSHLEDGRFIDLNHEFQILSGWIRDELINHTSIELKIWVNLEMRTSLVSNLLKSGRIRNFEMALRSKSGKIIDILFSADLIEIGEEICMLSSWQDITALKKAEKEIEISGSRLDLAMQAANMAWWEMHLPSGKVVFDKRKSEMLGYPPEKFNYFQDFVNLVHPEDQLKSMDALRAHIDGKQKKYEVEYRILTVKGEYKWFYDSGSIVKKDSNGNPELISGFVLDITERKQKDAAVHHSESKYQDLFNLTRLLTDTMQDLLWAKNLDKKFIFVNKAICEKLLCAGDISEPIDKTELFFANRERNEHPNDPEWHTFGECCVDSDELTLKEMREMNFEEYGNVRGKFLFLDVHKAPLFNKEGKLIGIIGSARDITSRKETEKLLEQTRQNYEEFFNTIDEFLWVLDEQGNVLHANKTVYEKLGYSREDLLGKSVLLVHPPERRDEAGRIVREMLSGNSEFCPVPVITKSGTPIPVETRVTHGIWNSKPVIFGITKNISKLKLSEEKFSKVFYLNPSACGLSDVVTGQYLEVNDAFTTLFGYTPDEVIGKSAQELGIMTLEIRNTILEKSDLNGNVINVEAALRAKNSEIKNVLLSSENIIIQGDKYRYTVANDITNLKKSEELLKESESKFRQLTEAIRETFWIRDKINRKIIYISPNYENVWGRSCESLYQNSQSFLESIHPEDREKVINEQKKLFDKEIMFNQEYRIIHTNGSIHWIRARTYPVYNSDGLLIRWAGIAEDITESRAAAERLILLSVALEAAVDAVVITDKNAGIEWINDSFEKMTGFTIEEIKGKNLREILKSGKHNSEFYKKMWDTISAGKPWKGEIINKRKDGILFYEELSLTPVLDDKETIAHFIAIKRDITERKKSEEALHLNYLYTQALLQLGQMTDATLNVINDFAMEKAIELTRSEIGYLAFLDEEEKILTMHSWSKSAMMNCAISEKPLEYEVTETGLWGEAVRQRKPVITNDYSFENPGKKGLPDGHVPIFRHLNLPVFDGNKIVMVAGVGNKETEYSEIDVNQISLLMQGLWRLIERKRAEESLRESKYKIELAANAARFGVWNLDLVSNKLEWDDWMLKLYMLDRIEFNGVFDTWKTCVHPEDLANAISEVEHAIRGEKYLDIEFRIIWKNGEIRTIKAHATVIDDARGKPVRMTGINYDITDRKNAEQAIIESNLKLEETLMKLRETQKQVLQQERMRSLGQLASGIAHDINNSLTPILGYMDLLSDDEEIMKKNEKSINMIIKSTKNIARTIGRLKEFYKVKLTEEDLVEIDLNKVILSTLELTKHKWKNMAESTGSVVEIKLELEEQLPLTRVDESEMIEALTNIILNACDAMPAGGKLSFKTYHIDENIVIQITDTGIGMDKETLSHCIDPFFTTKGEKGTGLGLAMVYGVIERHQGIIEIDSEPNIGTTVCLILPINREKIQVNAKYLKKELTKSLNILIVEDDSLINNLLKDILELRGHKVVSANDGKMGLELYKKFFNDGKLFDLLLTDLGMPGMDGHSLSKVIKKMSPELPVILLTGWGALINKDDYPEINCVLKKPIMREDLFKAINSLFKEN